TSPKRDWSSDVCSSDLPVRALIFSPTRELADQVYQSVKQYSEHTPLRSTVVFGGVDMQSQTEALRQGCEVLVATPGRLLDHMEQIGRASCRERERSRWG